MLRHYWMSALRHLARDKLHTGITIAGLAIGLAAAFLITVVVRNQASYDRFVPGYEQVALVAPVVAAPGHAAVTAPATQPALAQPLRLDFPMVQRVARVEPQRVGLRHGRVEAAERIGWADPGIFEVLPFRAIAGDLATALDRPDGIVLTRAMAIKYFGRSDPVGQTIEIDRQHPMRVAAVIEDLPPSGTEIEFKIFAAGQAAFSPLAAADAQPPDLTDLRLSTATFLRLRPGAPIEALQAAMPDFVERHLKAAETDGVTIVLSLIRLDALHLDPGLHPGTWERLVALSAVGLLILVLAAINHVNLMTARATRRALEVGVRKALGAGRRDLIVQFLGESLLFVAVAVCLAVAVAELMLPAVNAFLDSGAVFEYWHDPTLIALILGAWLTVGLLAGAYPALLLSAFRPATVLKGGPVRSGEARAVRQLLVTLQFAVLIILVLGTATVYRQQAYETRDRLRIDKDEMLMVRTPCADAFEGAVRALPGVRAAACSAASVLAGSLNSDFATTAAGARVLVFFSAVEFGWFEQYGVTPLAGRLFARERGGDASSGDGHGTFGASLVLNETAARRLGFASPEAAVGQMITVNPGSYEKGVPSQIIGVVPDLPMTSVDEPVEPTTYYVDPSAFALMSIKLSGRDIPETLKAIDGAWDATGHERPIQRFFLDDYFQNLYLALTREAQAFGVFAGIAVLLAAFGLFGLSAFAAERRTKEIGVRKAMGADTLDIMRLLVWQFAKPVLWANLVAWPIAWLLLERWLDGFAYRIAQGPLVFLAAGVAALGLAVGTTALHVIQVAHARPVTALRYE